MASRDINLLDERLRTAYTEAVVEWGKLYPDDPQPFATCTHRDNEEQEILFMMSRNGKDDDGDGKIDEADEWRTNARPGTSEHNKLPARAVDVAFRRKDNSLDWSERLFARFAEFMKKRGIEWGGDWIKLGKAKRNDTPHFQLPKDMK
ncbi:MAG TPA: M15 family metallopeptidase [Bacilli bacterium]|nr:M15 family metallopeptidase [Bacilli bacterium]